MKLSIKMRRLLGNIERALSPGYGLCYRCGRPWSRARWHATYYTDYRACLPMCEDCFQETTIAERIPYYAEMIQEWERQGATVKYEQKVKIYQAVIEGK